LQLGIPRQRKLVGDVFAFDHVAWRWGGLLVLQ